jgi:hypothetical protein
MGAESAFLRGELEARQAALIEGIRASSPELRRE